MPTTAKNWLKLPTKDGGFIAVRSQSRTASDSGMMTGFQPAQHQKTGRMGGVIANITAAFLSTFRRDASIATTEQGAQSSASPSTYLFSLYQLRYERRAVIQECRQSFDDDSRVFKSVRMFGREAVRGGVVITINEAAKPVKMRGRRSKQKAPTISKQSASKAKFVATRVQDIANPLLESWATMELVEGESFIQAVVKGDVGNGEIVKAKRMPTAAMERNTDDADEFTDPAKAFSQVDILTNSETATFPISLVNHSRWNHVDGERYGKSEIISIRRLRRLVLLCEDAQARRRIARATLRIHWEFGGAYGGQIIAPEWSTIEEFKEKNGFVNGRREQFDPTEIGRDTFGSFVKPIPIQGDATIADIDDLKYLQNVMAVGLPTPAPLYNLDASSINRAELETMRAEWLKETQILSGKMEEIIRWLVDLGLLLQGIVPESVDYTVRFSESTVETPSDMVDRVCKLRQNSIGTGRNAVPDPLVSRRTALTLLAEHIDIDNVEDEERDIDEEMANLAKQQPLGVEPNNVYAPPQTTEAEADLPQRGVITPMTKRQLVPAGAANGRNGNGAKPTPAEATARYTGIGQAAAKWGSTYGQPEENGYSENGNI